jgi:hypothetical protein
VPVIRSRKYSSTKETSRVSHVGAVLEENFYRGDRQVARIGKSPGEHQNEPPPSVNQFNTTSGCIYIEMEEVVEQGNAINLYYLIFLGMVILRPVLVTLGGGAWDDSPP